ncbi:MAG TPA: hypothetical protein VED18_17990 [Candidatus Sulfotelmatobacter sp.]|nr:hypothetical protein [Candidatus Sulfotelmatobacter sp.]
MEQKLNFLISAYNTAQNMIRFSDEKATVVFIFYGILLALLGTRADKVIATLRAPGMVGLVAVLTVLIFFAFLGLMIYGLVYALRTITPTFEAGVEAADRKRIYWCHDVQGREPQEYLQIVESLGDRDILREMVYELYSVQKIEKLKFDRVGRATRSAMVSLILWQVMVVLTFFL